MIRNIFIFAIRIQKSTKRTYTLITENGDTVCKHESLWAPNFAPVPVEDKLTTLDALHWLELDSLDFLRGVTKYRPSFVHEKYYLKISFVPKMTHVCRLRVKLQLVTVLLLFYYHSIFIYSLNFLTLFISISCATILTITHSSIC